MLCQGRLGLDSGKRFLTLEGTGTVVTAPVLAEGKRHWDTRWDAWSYPVRGSALDMNLVGPFPAQDML